MGVHQDKDESPETIAAGVPIVSVSIGDTARFVVGGLSRKDPMRPLLLHSGDVIVMGGPSRLRFHGVTRIQPGTAPEGTGPGRFNLTFRKDERSATLAAFFASVRTASTIAISPIPLPIEMLRRKIRSTMSQSTVATSAAAGPRASCRGSSRAPWPRCRTDSRRRSAASACRRAASSPRCRRPTRTGECGSSPETASSRLGRDFLELIGVAQEQVRAIGGIGELVERFEQGLEFFEGHVSR